MYETDAMLLLLTFWLYRLVVGTEVASQDGGEEYFCS